MTIWLSDSIGNSPKMHILWYRLEPNTEGKIFKTFVVHKSLQRKVTPCLLLSNHRLRWTDTLGETLISNNNIANVASLLD